MNFNIDVRNVGSTLQLIETNGTQVVKAVIRAMNRSLTSGNALMARRVAEDIHIKVSDVKKHIIMRRAAYARPHAELATRKLNRFPLFYLNASGPMPSGGKGRGVSYSGLNGLRKRIPNAFITQVKYYAKGEDEKLHTGVFVRAGRAGSRTGRIVGMRKSPKGWSLNLPIQQLYGPSLGHVFAKYRPEVGGHMQEQFDLALEHELSRTDANA